MTFDLNDPKELRRFMEAYLKVLRGNMPLKDSAWLTSADSTGIKSAERPSPGMIALIGFHEKRLARLLRRATLFVYWMEGDTAASVSIMQVPVDDKPFQVIKLPFPPSTFRPSPLLIAPGM